jgi:tetrahydromethanopterin S-methyltransferase subunit H
MKYAPLKSADDKLMQQQAPECCGISKRFIDSLLKPVSSGGEHAVILRHSQKIKFYTNVTRTGTNSTKNIQ